MQDAYEHIREFDFALFDSCHWHVLNDAFRSAQDTDRSGTIGYNEFAGLWQYIQEWQKYVTQLFSSFLPAIPIRDSPSFCSSLVAVFSDTSIEIALGRLTGRSWPTLCASLATTCRLASSALSNRNIVRSLVEISSGMVALIYFSIFMR